MFNKVLLIGRIANDFEIRKSSRGESYTNFNIAINDRSKSNPSTVYIRCVAFRQTADYMNNYLSKGALVHIEGSLNTSEYTDQNGIRRTNTDVIVNSLISLETRAKREGQASYNQNNYNNYTNNSSTTMNEESKIPLQSPEQYQSYNQNQNDNIPIEEPPVSDIFGDGEWN